MDFIDADKRAAAELWVRANGSRESVDSVLAIISDPRFRFTTLPLRIMIFADFLYRQGPIRRRPESWRNLFRESQHGKPGS